MLIISSVFLASADYLVISLVVCLVLSKLSISSLLSKMVAGSASLSDWSNYLSSLSNYTEKSFCYLTNSCFYISKSALSWLTT